METRLIPDEQPLIERTLVELVDTVGCHLVLTTGGTGPAPRDVTPEATLAVAHKVLPGFGEQMRQVSLKYVPTAILSRQVGVIRGRALILNLPGQPKAIKETLDGVFPAVPYCIDLIGGPYIETHDDVCKAFRPKSAVKPAAGVSSAANTAHARRVRTGIAFVVASAVAFGAMAILARFAFASGVDTTTLLALRFAHRRRRDVRGAARPRPAAAARIDARRAGRARRGRATADRRSAISRR